MDDRASRISPWLEVADPTAALAFYEAAFGAESGERIVGDDGVVEVANLRVGDADFWVQRDPSAPRGGPVRLILTVADPDATFARAVAAGATVVNPVAEGHGWRVGRIVDPAGLHWEIGRPL